MRKIFFRIDCSNEVGMGHWSRSKTLMDYFHKDEIDLYVRGTQDLIDPVIQKFKNVFFIKEPDSFLDEEFLSGYDLGIFDFSTKITRRHGSELKDYFYSIKKKCKKVLLIDGLREESLLKSFSDLPIDFALVPYAGADKNIHQACSYWAGPEYFVFSQDILQIKPRSVLKSVNELLITMGGADPAGMTLVALDILKSIEAHLNHITVVIGPHFSASLKKRIQDKIADNNKYTIVSGEKGLLHFYPQTDVCLSASGLTKYELAKVGIPSVLLSHDKIAAQNNIEFSKMTGCLDLGFFQEIQIQEAAEIIKEILINHQMREKMQAKLVDLFSQNKIALVINSIKESYEK